MLLVTLIAMGQITPRCGIDLFVILEGVAAGALPQVALMGMTIALLTAFPALALWLPGLM